MNAEEIIKISSLFVNVQDEVEQLINNNDVSGELDMLLKCLNLTLCEVADDYLPILNKETICIDSNKLYFDDLIKPCKEIISIKLSDSNKNIKFTQYANYVYVSAKGYVDIVYKTNIDKVNIDSVINQFPCLSSKCLALGTASEYCYINGFYEEAEMWDKRFKDSLQIACRKKKEIVMPKRWWV